MKVGIGIEPVYSRRKSGFGASPKDDGGGISAAIAYAARGTIAAGTGDGSGVTLASGVSVATGSTLVVFLEYPTKDQGDGPISVGSVVWNGHSLALAESPTGTFAKTPLGTSGATHECWMLANCPSGTGDIVADDSDAGGFDFINGTVVEVTGAATSSLDHLHVAHGPNSIPSSGATATTTQADELLLGSFAYLFSTIQGGSLVDPYVAGQVSTGGGNAIQDCSAVVAATGAYTMSKYGSTSTPWSAILVTLKRAS